MANELYNSNPSVVADPAHGLSAKAYSIQYLKALYAKLGAHKHVRSFDADVSAFGESVSMASFPRLTPVAVTQSTGAFTYDNTSILQQTITINKQVAVPYSVPENVLLQSKIDVKSALASEAARCLNDDIDHEMTKLISALTTNTAGSANADLTEPYVLAAIGKLVENYWDITNPDDMVFILPASQFSAVHALKGYANSYRIVAGSTSSDGMNDVRAAMDTLYGIPLFFRADSEMTVTSGKIGGLFARDSVGVAIQRVPSLYPPMRIPGTVNLEMATTMLYGIAVIKDAVAVKVLCK